MQVPVAGVQTPQAVLPPRMQRRKYAGFLGGHLGSNYEKTRKFLSTLYYKDSVGGVAVC